MNSANTKYKIKVHFVRHQFFYTPIYLCEKDFLFKYELNYIDTETNQSSDRELVKALFSGGQSKPYEIDIFITGGPHVSIYCHLNKDVKENSVIYWTSIVDRLPVQVLQHGKQGKNDLTINEVLNHQNKIYTAPIDTSIHYFLSQFYYGKYFYDNFFVNQGITDKEAVDDFYSLKGPLSNYFEGISFEKLDDKLKEDKFNIGFGMTTDSEISFSEKYSPPIEIIPFTCVFTRNDIWMNPDKRKVVKEICAEIQFKISSLHRYAVGYYEKDKDGNFKTEKLDDAIKHLKKGNGEISLEDKNIFINNLRYLVRNRIFAENLNNDLILRRENPNRYFYNQVVENNLFNWIINKKVAIESAITTEEYIDELAQTEFLKSISASTHAIKTTINTLLSAPLNSIKIGNKDFRVNLLAEAKDTLLINTELINLLSKLSIGNYSQESKEKALLDSKWFAEGNTNVDLQKLIEKKIEVCLLDKIQFPKAILLNVAESKFDLSENFLRINRLCPTIRFFEFMLLTVIENCNKHAKTEKFKINFSINCNENELVFCNKPKNENYTSKQLTGNYRVIDSILKTFKIGKLKLELNKGLFYTKIISTKIS